jgi:hypothetical protein
MAMLNRAGTFRAIAVKQGFAQRPGKALELAMAFNVFQEAADGAWQDCAQEEITGYVYPECKNGSVNEPAMRNLNEAFGCPLHDVTWMQAQDFTEKPVQIQCDFEEFNGKTKLKVQYINPDADTPRVSGGGVVQASEDTLKAIRARLNPKCRALFGAPVTTKAPPPKPAQPQTLLKTQRPPKVRDSTGEMPNGS